MKTSCLGIDISKKTFHAALILEGRDKPFSHHFSNEPKGFKELLAWLNIKSEKAHVCMEATGGYEQPLAIFMHSHGYPVSVVNPAKIHAFAKSELSRCKTDKADAKLIARYCWTLQPSLWQPEAEHIRNLKELNQQLDSLKIDLNRVENRGLMAAEIVKATIEEYREFLSRKIQELEEKIKQFIESHPELQEKKKLLVSIPGVGDGTAPKMLCLLAEEGKFLTGRKVCAFIGLTSKERQSGTSVLGKGHISKIGDAQLRKALYMPAMVAIKYCPSIKRLAERLKKKKKPGKVIIVAAMRKLLCLMFGVLKNHQPYKADWSVA